MRLLASCSKAAWHSASMRFQRSGSIAFLSTDSSKIVTLTLSTTSSTPATTSNFIVTGTDGAGGTYVLFAAGSPHEGAVHYYNLEDQAEPIHDRIVGALTGACCL